MLAPCAQVKDYERVTNHDVKAVEYALKDRMARSSHDSSKLSPTPLQPRPVSATCAQA